jgi:hypothetical protein
MHLERTIDGRRGTAVRECSNVEMVIAWRSSPSRSGIHMRRSPALRADISRAGFYPEDDRYLADRELTVSHYEIVSGDHGA